MMKLTNKLAAVAILLGLVFTIGCKEDDGPGTDPAEIPGEELAGTWIQDAPEDVTGPAAAEFTAFTITINATESSVSYSTTGSGDLNVFPAAGTFVVEDTDDATASSGANIVRNPDEVAVNAKVSADGQSLLMTFTINTAGGEGGRYKNVDGDYVFNLSKQE